MLSDNNLRELIRQRFYILIKETGFKHMSSHITFNRLIWQTQFARLYSWRVLSTVASPLQDGSIILSPLGHCTKRENSWKKSLQWRHNEPDGVSNHQPRDCLLNRLLGRRSKKTSKSRVIGLKRYMNVANDRSKTFFKWMMLGSVAK